MKEITHIHRSLSQLLPTWGKGKARGIAEVLLLSVKDTMPDLDHCLQKVLLFQMLFVMFCLKSRDEQGSVLKHVLLPSFI